MAEAFFFCWAAGQRVGNTYGGFAGNGYGQRAPSSYGASSSAERLAKFARSSRMDKPSWDGQNRQAATYSSDTRGMWQDTGRDNADWRKFGATRKRVDSKR